MWTLFLGILLGLAIPPFYKWVVGIVTNQRANQWLLQVQWMQTRKHYGQ